MATVIARHRDTPRPVYLPTALHDRLMGKTAPTPLPASPSPVPSDALAALIPTIHPDVPLPATPIPTRKPKIYNPSE